MNGASVRTGLKRNNGMDCSFLACSIELVRVNFSTCLSLLHITFDAIL